MSTFLGPKCPLDTVTSDIGTKCLRSGLRNVGNHGGPVVFWTAINFLESTIRASCAISLNGLLFHRIIAGLRVHRIHGTPKCYKTLGFWTCLFGREFVSHILSNHYNYCAYLHRLTTREFSGLTVHRLQ